VDVYEDSCHHFFTTIIVKNSFGHYQRLCISNKDLYFLLYLAYISLVVVTCTYDITKY